MTAPDGPEPVTIAPELLDLMRAGGDFYYLYALGYLSQPYEYREDEAQTPPGTTPEGREL